jgi:hypothetical protein
VANTRWVRAGPRENLLIKWQSHVGCGFNLSTMCLLLHLQKTTLLFSAVLKAHRKPDNYSLGYWDLGANGEPVRLQFDDSSLQPDHGRLRSVVGAQFGEDVLDSPLDGLLGDRELIGDLLIGVSGCDQAQHVDFCRC